MAERMQQPPRRTGVDGADIATLFDYMWAMYQNLILEGGVPQTVDQPEESVDPETGILTALPVGFILGTVDPRDPAEYLGYGTWERFGIGKVLVGVDEDDVDFDTVEETGGAKTATPTGTNSAPTFTGAALGTHSHGVGTLAADSHGVTTQTAATGVDFEAVTAIDDHALSGSTDAVSAGTPAGTVSAPTFTGDPVSVVQPFVSVYYFKRTA